MKVWIADLTYTQQVISNDIFPAAQSGILEYTKQNVDFEIETEVFKFPPEFDAAFQRDKPDIVGFSNYIWNCNLSLKYAEAIKRKFPEIPIIMGGPNFPIEVSEQKQFLSENKFIDFYVFKEGELGWLNLIKALYETNFDKNATLKRIDEFSNTVALDEDCKIKISNNMNRLTDVSQLPSPYLNGALDKFFDSKLLPIIQTNRGCPFTCTFCTEGQSYWTKVRKKTRDMVQNEIEYITKKIVELPDDKRRYDFYIADSNFGMFLEDIDTCMHLAKMQTEYDYPKYVNVTTGKNKRERVLEAARLVKGAIKITGSVQSLDEEVLEAIKRKNISADKLLSIAKEAQSFDSNVMSEVILGLPTDTREKHFDTLKKLVDSSFNFIVMYQLMMLPGTEMNNKDAWDEFKFDTRHRVLPRCFGYYDFLGEEIVSSELEEIAVANSTLSFQDYLDCRKMNFIISIFYNDGIFEEIIKLIENNNLSAFEWLKTIYENDTVKEFNDLVEQFLDETNDELWESKEDLYEFATKKENVEKYIDGEYGNNLMLKYKALSITQYFDAICEIAMSSFDSFSRQNKIYNSTISDVVKEIIKFKHYKISNIFDLKCKQYEDIFEYDISRIKISDIKDESFDLNEIKFKEPIPYVFLHSPKQSTMIDNYLNLFGDNINSLAKIVSRVHLKQFFREAIKKV